MKMVTNAQMVIAKRRLKTAYLEYINYADGFSCGRSLADHVSPTLGALRSKVNVIIRRIKKLDPSCAVEELR